MLHRGCGLDQQSVQKAVTDLAQYDTDGGMRQPLDNTVARRLTPYAELNREERRLIRTSSGASCERRCSSHTQCSRAPVSQRCKRHSIPDVAHRFGEKIDAFLKFIAKRCSPRERAEYLDALNRMQPGIRGETLTDKDDDN